MDCFLVSFSIFPQAIFSRWSNAWVCFLKSFMSQLSCVEKMWLCRDHLHRFHPHQCFPVSRIQTPLVACVWSKVTALITWPLARQAFIWSVDTTTTTPTPWGNMEILFVCRYLMFATWQERRKRLSHCLTGGRSPGEIVKNTLSQSAKETFNIQSPASPFSLSAFTLSPSICEDPWGAAGCKVNVFSALP